MKNSNKFLFLVLMATLLVFTGCVDKISEIKSEDFVDETVTVKGTVENTIKLGALSGYTIKDADGESIFVSSEELPKEGDTKRVSGTLKNNLLGYYIEIN